MDPNSTLAKKTGEAPSSDGSPRPGFAGGPTTHPAGRELKFPAEDGGKSLAEMAQRDLNATLQLLAERAQYITGATGAAIALRDSENMVCRASAGPSAPEIGTQLQINSGLSGESVRTRQTLRCDDSHTDNRVNRESCEALGIRSVVVMPLLKNEEVIGVFELFSDQPNIFEARDLAALERMGAMVHTALEQSASTIDRQPAAATTEYFEPEHPAPSPSSGAEAAIATSSQEERSDPQAPASPAATPSSPEADNRTSASRIAFHMRMPAGAAPAPALEASVTPSPPPAESSESLPRANEEFDVLDMPSTPIPAPTVTEGIVDDVLAEIDEHPSVPADASGPVTAPEAAVAVTSGAQPVPEEAPPPIPESRSAVATLRKCEACGFPVSEGRQLCLDCERKRKETTTQPKESVAAPAAPAAPVSPSVQSSKGVEPKVEEALPHFLGGEEDVSWIASHKILVATILIAILAVLGAYLLR